MEKNLTQLKSDNDDHDDFKCDECGEEYSRPLLARMSSQGRVQTYYACPRCLTEVPEATSHKTERNEEHVFSAQAKKNLERPETETSCNHFFGYLKKREKDSSIPEDCLTCEKMIECMVY